MPLYKGSSYTLTFVLTTTGGAAYTTSGTPPTVYLSKDGATPAASTNTATYLADSLWALTFATTETSCNILGYSIVCAGCLPQGGSITFEGDYSQARAVEIDDLPTILSDVSALSIPTAAAITSAVWAAATRTLTAQSDSSGVTTLLSRIPGLVEPISGDAYAAIVSAVTTLEAAISAAVTSIEGEIPGAIWGNATRTLTAFPSVLTALAAMINGSNEFTAPALSLAPTAGGGGGIAILVEGTLTLTGDGTNTDAYGSLLANVGDTGALRLRIAGPGGGSTSGAPVNLTGLTAVGSTTTETGTAVSSGIACTIIDAAGGLLSYPLQSADTATGATRLNLYVTLSGSGAPTKKFGPASLVVGS